ncbi:MAG: MFS transporter [Acidimicrobiales bacterium]
MSPARRVVSEATLDAAGAEGVLLARAGLVLERVVGGGVFEAEAGPLAAYRRTVTVSPPRDDGRVDVRQVVEYEVSLPYFGWLFARPVRRHLSALGPTGGSPWWAPADRLDARAAVTLATLCAVSAVTGYLGTVLTQTITFAADEFGAGKAAQGTALAAVRADVIITVVLVALADRRGRRRLLLWCAAAGCVLTALSALAPSLPALAGSQVVARSFVTAAALLVAIMAAEEMPSGGRAYAVSLLGMSAGLGAGICVLLLPLADLGPRGWRLIFAVALVGLPIVASTARRLPESRRFRAPHAAVAMAGHGARFWLLAVSAFLFNVFYAPASQFQNEYLRSERGFSAGRISLFTVATGLPGAIGVVVGGRLAERGRRRVGAGALVFGVAATVIVYRTSGWPIWAWSVVGSMIGAATVPALGVYGPELFPTSLRGRANGIIGVLGRFGSVVGLVAAGALSAGAAGRLGPVMMLLAIGPLALAVLVLTAYPETAHRELEDLNPEDLPPVRR